MGFEPVGLQPDNVTLNASLSGTMQVKGGATRIKIAEVVLGSAASSIDFTSIPSGYKFLELIGSVSVATDTTPVVRSYFNNDSTVGNYQTQFTNANSSTVASSVNTTSLALMTAGTVTAGDQIQIHQTISNESGINHIYSGFAAQKVQTNICFGQWSNTTEINRITLTTQSGNNFNAGSRIQLWGYQ